MEKVLAVVHEHGVLAEVDETILMLLLYVMMILTMLFYAYKVSFKVWVTCQEYKEKNSQRLMKTI